MAHAFIAVGSNIEPAKNIRQALRLLAQSVRLIGISSFYRDPAVIHPEQPLFYNGVVAIETRLPPIELKWVVLRRIEAVLGRHRTEDKYAARTIDLDLISYEHRVLAAPQLTLPDPNILKRAFVAIPLAELAPDLVLPGSGVPIRQAARQLASNQLEPLDEFTRRLRAELLSHAGDF
jgi:2-amino-4-hydroxy-6-hydroxymethyldihydropteridine diphosphokinase